MTKILPFPKASSDEAEKIRRKIASQKYQWLRSIMRDTEVSPFAFRLACLLVWEYRNESKGGECYPSLATLAADFGVNEKTVRRAIDELVTRK